MQGVFCAQALIIQSRNSKPISLTSSKSFPGDAGKVKSRDGILLTLEGSGGIFIPPHPGHPSTLTQFLALLFPKPLLPQIPFCPWQKKNQLAEVPLLIKLPNHPWLYSHSNHPWSFSNHCHLYRNHTLKFSSVLSCSLGLD